jgi:hypothetical protein
MRASFDIEQSIAATTALYEEVLAERSLRRRAAGGP